MKLKDKIYSVGVMNPQLRVFDIIMRTDFGTTYNSYLVKGENKTALIETVHTNFFDEYLQNVEEVCSISEIDYIVMNHNEPDHSGSVAKLLALNPNIEIVCTMAGNRFLKAISNTEFKSHIVKDGDVIDLGGMTLKFIIAPFLHWPDSMFTYIEENGTLFSCDFLGCHYCEPQMLDSQMHYPQAYEHSFKYYYDCIFGPFKQHVLYGLDKIKDLNLDMICPSHGPVLVEGIRAAIDKYKEYSTPKPRENSETKIVIVYVSAYGCTELMAQEMAKAITKLGDFEVEIINAIEYDGNIAEKVEEADAVLFGSPTINRDALKPIWDVISSIDAVNCAGKNCGVFGSYGWSGEAVGMLVQRLTSLKFKVFGDGFKVNFVPSELEIEGAREYATNFAKELSK